LATPTLTCDTFPDPEKVKTMGASDCGIMECSISLPRIEIAALAAIVVE
jgi:hypothetical protein